MSIGKKEASSKPTPSKRTNRRQFVGSSTGLLLSLGVLGCAEPSTDTDDSAIEQHASDASGVPMLKPFRISLAQWSLHREQFGDWARRGEFERFNQIAADPESLLTGELDPLAFAASASEMGFEGVEYVNTFFYGKASDELYLAELKKRAEDNGVESLLIMCDALGSTGDPDSPAREQAVSNHFPWIDAAAFLGCHSVRVNAYSEGSFEEQQNLVSDGLHKICEYADQREINVLVENHGGLSSNGQWLMGVMKQVDHPRIGTLPDFGNFLLTESGVEPQEWYDRYLGVEELMPLAKAVSAKSYAFDEQGNETTIDFARMMRLVHDARYEGWVGVEFEGPGDSKEGIIATRLLLERLRADLWV